MSNSTSELEKSSALKKSENAEEYFADFLASAEPLKKYQPEKELSGKSSRLRDDSVKNPENEEGFVTVPRVLK